MENLKMKNRKRTSQKYTWKNDEQDVRGYVYILPVRYYKF